MCASSRIKHCMCSPSYGFRAPYVCLYCAKKLFNKLQKCTGTRTKNIFKNEQKVGMLLQKRADTRGVGISNMRKSIYLLTTTPTRHTHLLLTTPKESNHTHLLLTTPINSTHSPQLSSILLTCAKFKVWMTIVESGWNVWVWLAGGGCG